MILLLLFSVGLNELIGPIENDMFRQYNGTVKVTYEQGAVDMEIIKSGQQILIQLLIPRNMNKDSLGDFYSFLLLPGGSTELEKGSKYGKMSPVIEYPIAYFDGKSLLGMNKKTFVSTTLVGYRTAILYVAGEFDVEGHKLVGESKGGHTVEFDRSSKLPTQVEIEDKKIILKDWRRVEGFGSLPGNVEVWINENKVGDRKLKSITNPEVGLSYFKGKKKDVPIMAE